MVRVRRYLRYPFSAQARKEASTLARDVRALIELLSRRENEYIVEAAELRVIAALDQEPIQVTDTRDPRDFLVYNTARLIVEKIGNTRLKEYQAEAESKAVNRYLSEEETPFVVNLASESFGWNIRMVTSASERNRLPVPLRLYELRMRFEDFLEVSPRFHQSSWKLINRPLDRGWVPVRRSELDRLISGKFKQLILQSAIEVPGLLPARLTEAVQRIESELGAKIRRAAPIEITETTTSAFPPCIAQMHADAKAGKNLPHEARFALAAFLLNIGMDTNEVMRVFSASPDFVHDLARYQVEHIAGQRRGASTREGYTAPGCRKLQGNGLCPVYLGMAYDPLCEYVLHPLQFYETRAWEISKGITNRSWYARKRQKKQSF
ncbi:MAG: hypothetical protein DRO73_00280 [Candidatus Thorarchaeota archaeon]|nr:MAG: hypothetical protein DRO73_00280 [Candidatus Thorarchaeota archaeon]RLI62237.1 MAG: hypothetical protein DRO93_01920 [Candidatus Thorarchaeota archaeon]